MPIIQHPTGKCLPRVCFMGRACKYWGKPRWSYKRSYICKTKGKDSSPSKHLCWWHKQHQPREERRNIWPDPKGLTKFTHWKWKVVGFRATVTSMQKFKYSLKKSCENFQGLSTGPIGLEGTGGLEQEETGLKGK